MSFAKVGEIEACRLMSAVDCSSLDWDATDFARVYGCWVAFDVSRLVSSFCLFD